MSEGSDFLLVLLEALRGETNCPNLEYLRTPERILAGHETDVYTLELRGGPPGFESPLIARCLKVSGLTRAASLESAIHEGLLSQGFPVPRVLVARDETPSFIVMERLPGVAAADGLEVESGLSARLLGLITAARLSVGLPERLGKLTAQLLALDAQPLLDALQARGLAPEAIGFERHLDNFAERVRSGELSGLEAGLAWLHQARPADPQHRAICHGDLAPNMLFHDGRLTGVIDWSCDFVTIGDPAFEIGNTRVMLQVPLPVPGPIRPVARAYQRWLVRRYEVALGPAWEFSPERVRYYEAWRCFRALIGAAETWKACAAGEAFPTRPDPWCLPELAAEVARECRARTGVAIDLPDPPFR